MLANYFSEVDEPHDINRPGVTNGIASSRWRFDELLGIDSCHLTDTEVKALMPALFEAMVARSKGNQWIKVHDAQTLLGDGRWLFPPHVSGCVVYIVRNPLDVAVSRAFHDGHGEMERAVELLCNPGAAISGGGKLQLRQFMGDWSHHIRSWTLQDAIPVLIVRYEDMLDDAARELARVIAFARPNETIEHSKIARAVANTAFDKLQATESLFGFRETTARQLRFFRSGKSGDWMNHLSLSQVDRIRTHHHDMMQQLDYLE